MRNCIKSYHVFLSSRLLQVLLYALYLPVMMFIMLVLLCICLDYGGGLSFGYTLSANLIFGGEVIWGYLVFGGVAAKETNKLEYLKTSKKGLPILKKALITDTIRRILWVTAIQWVPLVITMEKPEASVWLANAMVLLFAELGCLSVRKSSSVTMLLAVIMAGTTILSPLLSVTMMIAHQIWPIILCYVLAVAVMVLNNKMVMKKARDSFYDDRNQKMSEDM